jgi:NTE family protein
MGEGSERPPVALCLAGGGFPGAFYEFGAVAALDAALTGWSPVRSRVIVGTSCGAIVGAILALGIDPAEALAALDDRRHPLAPRMSRLQGIPWRAHARGLARALVAYPGDLRPRDGERGLRWREAARNFEERLPAGFFSNAGVGRLVRRAEARRGIADRFDALPAPLLVTATDLDGGGRRVYGTGHDAGPPVSLAVQGSTTIPGYFIPVRIGEHDVIDGQIAHPIHLDLAALPEVKLILAVSPLVAYRPGPGERRVRDAGTSGVMDQMARMSAEVKGGLAEDALRRERPDLRILHLRPSPAEALTLIRARFTPRDLAAVWRLGFGAAARTLRNDAAAPLAPLAPFGVGLDLEALARAEGTYGVSAGRGA